MLTDYEFEITRELINIALANSADAFSKMAQERVLIRAFDLEILTKNTFTSQIESDLQNPSIVLTTEVKGFLVGKSYLIFHEEDIRKVIRIFSKEEMKNSLDTLSEFQKAILLELDNIVSAAMVSQISNILGLFTYGDIPHLSILTKEETLKLFNEDILKYDVALRVHAKLQSYNSSLSPSFVWLFKEDFLLAIKDLVERKKHLSLIREK